MVRIERMDFTQVIIAVMVVAICVSPRIPLPVIIPFRRVDLRLEDILIAVASLTWIFRSIAGRKIYLTPLVKPIGVYFFVIIITSCIALLGEPSNGLRVILYVLKYIEYFIVFFLVANFINSEKKIKMLLVLLVAGGLINVVWVITQIISGAGAVLFQFSSSEGVYSHPALFSNYGICLIGEASPFSVSGFFALLSYIFYSYFFSGMKSIQKNIIVFAGGVVFSLFSIMVGEKISTVFFFACIFTFAMLKKVNMRKILSSITFLLILIGLLHLMGLTPPIMERVFDVKAYAIQSDRLDRWGQLIPFGFNNMFTGVGTGVLWKMPDATVEEAHNNYIKVFLESGIFGLAAFIWLLLAVSAMCVRLYKYGSLSVSRISSGIALSAVLGLSLAAIVQDAFKPVLLNEIFWVYIGLAASAYRIEIFRIRQAMAGNPQISSIEYENTISSK